MKDILVTGFEPFDGREVNGSWIAASSLEDVHHLQMPVVWGKPLPLLSEAIETVKPRCIISLGEGREGWFDIETKARNSRKYRLDNSQSYPTSDILPGKIDRYDSRIDFNELHRILLDQDLPIRISEDAGQFLCEETLYCLEHLSRQTPHLDYVVFVHLPPFGSNIHLKSKSQICDEALLADFAQRLISAVKQQLSSLDRSKNQGISSLQRKNHG